MLDTFFSYLKKGLVAIVFLIFGFVATYIPQPYNEIKTVEAGGLGGGSTEPTQIANNVQLGAVNVATTASAAFDSITSWATGSLWFKENILDGIGWAIAKKIVSSMVQSLINWINSGFQGSPAFIQDLKGFLLNAADEAIGEYIEDLGGIGSFICSPFRLDVQVSVAMQYAQARNTGQSAPSCTLSGIIGNIENFLGGSFSEGGWDNWFKITSTPQTYTPYGAILNAQIGAHAKIINAKGEELTLLDWGDGFLSGKICEAAHGAGTSRENCFISKPGKIIEEALSFNLDTGRQSLITADEINELIAALLGQLANTALTGVAGLLGLSGGTGYTYSGFNGGSYLDQMVASSSELVAGAGASTTMADALEVQIELFEIASSSLNTPTTLASIGNLNELLASLPPPPPATNACDEKEGECTKYREVERALADANEAYTETVRFEIIIERLLLDYHEATENGSTTLQAEILDEFTGLDVYTEGQKDAYQATWERLLVRPLP